MSLFDLNGKVALLTGASKGMGFEMAKGLAEHGATVVISSRNQEDLDATAAEINKAVAGSTKTAS
jgi:NAD(P)-dependent dehydrogenase (short-subunit alcohol dehydrogenase family)